MHFKCVGIYGILILMLQVLCKVSFTYFFSLFISNKPFAIPALDMIPLELTMDNRDLKKEKDDDEYFEYACAKSRSRPLFTGKKRAGKCAALT